MFHNAWNLDDKKLELFSNFPRPGVESSGKDYKRIDATTLCACSALPFIEETVKIGGNTYCEGALVDTVNFWNLLEDHPDLDEIWVSRIVDSQQIRKPKDLHDSLANLCQLFAATVGDDDVKLFKYHVKEDKKWKGTIVEIRVDSRINFEWSRANLDLGRERGRRAAEAAYKEYINRTGGRPNNTDKVRIIPED
jgi:predicted patatin/cPLA2 family phospholipase